MNKFINFCLIIFAFIFLEWACHDCNLVSEQLLTDLQKSQNPFKGFEIITFNSGDSIVEFTGTGRHNTIKEYDISTSYCNWGVIEYNDLTFVGEDHRLYLDMVGPYVFNISLYELSTDFDVLTTFHIDQTTGELSNYEELIDSLTINNSLYFKIYKNPMVDVSHPNDIPDSAKHAIYLYYSTDFGVVKIDFSDSTSWELENIEW